MSHDGGVRAARRFAAMPFRLLRGRDLALHAAAVTFYGGIAVVPVALLAIWLTGLVAGAARVRRLTAYTVDALPTAVRRRDGRHRESMVVKVETDLPAEQLALIGCGVTTGVGAALNTAKVQPGSTVAVIGCGGVGQSVIQGARIAGASRIFAIDPVEMKRKTAEQHGATDLIDPAEGDPVAQVQAAHRRPRRRLRVRGHRPARDDPPGVQHRPPRRHRVHRRHAPHRRPGHVPGLPAVLRREEDPRLLLRHRPGAPRLPAVRRA